MDYEPPAMHQGVFFVHEVRIGGGGVWDVRSGKWLIANADNNFIVRVAAQILYFRVNYKKLPHGHL
jgi:hypothetical protein